MTRARPDGHAVPDGALARNLWHHRVAAGLSIRDLAEASGVDVGNLSRLERGRHVYPTIDTCVRITRALGITLDQLVAPVSDVDVAASPLPSPQPVREAASPAAGTSAAAAPAAARPTGTQTAHTRRTPGRLQALTRGSD